VSVSDTTVFTAIESIRQAHGIIFQNIRETPVDKAPHLERGDGDVWLKLESQQVTGSFKARGALHRVAMLSDIERRDGIVACSAGNHALGVAHACAMYGVKATIFVPSYVDTSRKHALEAMSVDLQIEGDSFRECEERAIAFASGHQKTFISPYNDPLVIAGQGTVALELLHQVPNVEVVVVAVGGGGLASGVAGYLKGVNPEIKVVGVSPANSAGLFDLVTGIPSDFTAHLETISDSTAGAIQEGSITVGLCKALIDQWILVEEEDIYAAMRYLFFEHRIVAEGAGALAVAAYIREQEKLKDLNSALIVCGGNIDPKRFLTIVNGPK
jgi:threonine dehydratase